MGQGRGGGVEWAISASQQIHNGDSLTTTRAVGHDHTGLVDVP